MSLWPDILDAKDGVTRERVAWITCSGTWAAPGTGYSSWVLQNADEGLVFEVPAQSPWSFGPVNSPDLNAPSYAESVAIGKDWAIRWLLNWPGLWGLGGYSQGGECASQLFEETYNGGQLAFMRSRFVGGFSIGDPMRPAGITGGGAPDPGGAGISDKLVAFPDPRWWYEANGPRNGAPGIDMYTATPLNGAGRIIRTFYTMCIQLGLNHPDVMLMTMIKGVMQLFTELAGVTPQQIIANAPSKLAGAGGLIQKLLTNLGTMTPATGAGGSILAALAPIALSALPMIGGPFAALGPLAALAIPLLTNVAIPSLVASAPVAVDAGKLLVSMIPWAGLADAVQAAIIGLQFLFEGTGPHISYENTDAVPGVNHIAHAIGHVNTMSYNAIHDWAAAQHS